MLLAKRQIAIAFEQAEKERLDLCSCVRDGMKAAKEIIRQHSKDFGGTLKDTEVIKLCGVSWNAYYRYKRQLKDG